MIASMTGFGAATVKGLGGTASVEVKSLNYRFCDVTIRLPRELSVLEPPLREVALKRLQRGKVDMTVRWEAETSAAPRLRREVLGDFLTQWQALRGELPALPELDARSLLTVPGVLDAAGLESNAEALAETVQSAALAAIDNLIQTREVEGARLADDLRQRRQLLASIVDQLEHKRGEVVNRYRQRLHERWEEICEGTGILVDKGRLEAEGMALADKADVTEEIVRLRAHLRAFDAILAPASEEAAGKPLDFLLQEFFREFNTIGSKARDVEVTSMVLKAKHELEKMREQAQNLV